MFENYTTATSSRVNVLTHWGRETHIWVHNLTIIGSDNGLSPGRRQAIIWTNAGILLIGTLWTNFSEILIRIRIFSFKKMGLKMSSAKWRPFCLGLKVLTLLIPKLEYCGKMQVNAMAADNLLAVSMARHYQPWYWWPRINWLMSSRGRVLTICTKSILRNNWKCKCEFVFLKMNSAPQGLRSLVKCLLFIGSCAICRDLSESDDSGHIRSHIKQMLYEIVIDWLCGWPH